MPKRFLAILVVLALAFCMWPASVRADENEEDLSILQMYYDDKDLQVSVTRNQAPLSSVAENITVITAEDITAMNAHTVGDVLGTIPGVQRDVRGGPGTISNTFIRGGHFTHLKVILDGIPITDIISNYPDFDAIPARMVERIEVLRGPASSSWGAALGGVVNIVTKNAPDDKKLSGSAYASIAENSFHDVGGDLAGTVGSLSYYLYSGNLSYNRLAPNNSVNMNASHARLSWNIQEKGDVTAIFGVSRPDRETGGLGMIDNNVTTYAYAGLSGRYRLLPDTEVELALRFLNIKSDLYQLKPTEVVGPGPLTTVLESTGPTGGASLVVRHRTNMHRFAAGVEFDTGSMKMTIDKLLEIEGGPVIDPPPATLRKHINKYGVFLTDTISIDRFSLTPGIRYDWTNETVGRDDISLSLGATYRVTDGTIVRASAGRGYSLPEIAEGRPVEKIWSVQGGVESTDVPYLWLRLTYFYNHLKNTASEDGSALGHQVRQGVEVEAKTVPIFNTSLSGGLMLMETMSERTNRTVDGAPTYQWNAGVRYDDGKLRASVLGHQVWWNSANSLVAPEYDDTIWDLHLSRKFMANTRYAPELFFSLHNIFDGSEYLYKYIKNPGRWAEGGIRFSF